MTQSDRHLQVDIATRTWMRFGVRIAPILDVAEDGGGSRERTLLSISALAVTCAMELKVLFTLDFFAEVEPALRERLLFANEFLRG